MPIAELEDPIAPESRYGIDGKWDLGIGLWFEGVVTHQRNPALVVPHQRTVTVGADYTFAVGSGLYVLAEYFALDQSRRLLGGGDGARLTAALVRYPLSLLDSLSAIVYIDTTRDVSYRFVSWQRTYDRWQLFVMGFWNPPGGSLYQAQQTSRAGQNPLTGRGVQLMAVFNH